MLDKNGLNEAEAEAEAEASVKVDAGGGNFCNLNDAGLKNSVFPTASEPRFLNILTKVDSSKADNGGDEVFVISFVANENCDN